MTDATPQTGQTGALLYEKDAYSTEGKRLLGRQAAGESFLRALVRYGQADTLFCFTRTREAYDAFCRPTTWPVWPGPEPCTGPTLTSANSPGSVVSTISEPTVSAG